MQGDILMDCPLLEWDAADEVNFDNAESELEGAVDGIRADVVVMTQACDLENNHVSNVLLCPHLSLEEYRVACEEEFNGSHQELTTKAWRKRCESIKQGSVWNLAMLNSREEGEIKLSLRIVDFHSVYTVPRSFLESMQTQLAQPRLRLLPPYREHLSQAFARFFMRVGLPMTIGSKWD